MENLFLYLMIATWIHIWMLHSWEESNNLYQIRSIIGYLSTVILYFCMALWWSNAEYLQVAILFQFTFETSFSIAWIVMIQTGILQHVAFLILAAALYVHHIQNTALYLIGMAILSCTKSEKMSKHLMFIPGYFHWNVVHQYKDPLLLLMINFGMGYFYYHHW